MPTTDERTGDRGKPEQKGGGGRGGEEEREKVETSTGESSMTTVVTLAADASQLSLIGQNKAKKCKKKAKKPPKASGDTKGSRPNGAKSDLDAASKQQSTGAAVIAAGQTLSKEKPTAATSSADAVSAAVGSSGISSNRGKSLSPFSSDGFLLTVAILAVFGQMQGVSGRLTIPPSNVLAKSGSEVRLPCSTDLTDPVYWQRRLMHGASSSSETQIFYYGDLGFSSSVNGRFKIDRSRGEGSYDVIISNVTAKDAGVYVCRDDGGMGERKEMQLVVFDYFNCTMPMPPVGFLGQNDIADDEIRASCNLKYHGNQKPRFHWRWSDNSMVDSAEEESESTTIVSRVMTLPRKELNGAKLTCTASISSALASASASASASDSALASDGSNGQDFSSSSSSSSSSIQWTSHQVTVLPASPQPGKVEQCKGSSLILVCNSECEYLESQLNDGLCQCVAVYRRSEDQRREFAFSVYSCAAESSSWNTLIFIIPFAIGAAMVMSAIPVIVVIIRKYKGKSKPEDEEKQQEPNESAKSSHNSINSTGSSDGSGAPLLDEPTV